MIIFKYLYHAACAAILNFRASRHARKVGKGIRGHGDKLRIIGARSNWHEDRRDEAAIKINGVRQK